MKKKCTILALDKGYDGISGEIIALANALVDLYDVHLLFLNNSNEGLSVNPKVNVTIKNVGILEGRKFYTDLFMDSAIVLSTSSEFSKYVLRYAKCKRILWEHYETTLANQKYLSKFDLIVVPNKKLKNYYLKYNKNTLIINDGIELPNEKAIRKGKNIIFIGKLTKDKRIDLLLDMYKNISIVTQTSLVIIGSGEMRSFYENKVKKDNLKNVYFRGLLTKEEVENELLNSAVYVNMNENDSTNLSMLEAMSYGVPVISFDTEESLFPFIVDEINGFLIKGQNTEIMYERIKSLLENEELLESFSLCAKEKSLEFDIYSLKIEWLKIL